MNFIHNSSHLFKQIRNQKPLILCITNYVTVNDCANAILAIGASPIMSDEVEDIKDLVKISNALVINIGTLNKRTLDSIIIAGKLANQYKIPVVFDPVGAGASSFRNEATLTILKNVQMSVIRGNLSEISFIAGMKVSTKGVDSSFEDSTNDSCFIAKKIAKKYNSIIAITGAIDTISDGVNIIQIQNGTKELTRITGTGCMTTALIGSFCGSVYLESKKIKVKTIDYFSSTIAAVSTMGIAGELNEEISIKKGTGSYRSAIIDSISKMNETIYEEKFNEAKY